MKDDYKKENPEVNLMGDKIIGPREKQIENTSKRLYTSTTKT